MVFYLVYVCILFCLILRAANGTFAAVVVFGEVGAAHAEGKAGGAEESGSMTDEEESEGEEGSGDEDEKGSGDDYESGEGDEGETEDEFVEISEEQYTSAVGLSSLKDLDPVAQGVREGLHGMCHLQERLHLVRNSSKQEQAVCTKMKLQNQSTRLMSRETMHSFEDLDYPGCSIAQQESVRTQVHCLMTAVYRRAQANHEDLKLLALHQETTAQLLKETATLLGKVEDILDAARKKVHTIDKAVSNYVEASENAASPWVRRLRDSRVRWAKEQYGSN